MNKVEIKTLQQGLSAGSSHVAADTELAQHLNDGWELLHITVIDNLSFDGASGGAYPLRVVTLLRNIASPADAWARAVVDLKDLIKRELKPGQKPRILVYAYEYEGMEDKDFLESLEMHRVELSPVAREKLTAAKKAFDVYEAWREGDN